ncbi:ABC transporter permease [Lutibaculum baratangense]|uniref:Putative deoxyribose-specific ABC transporter, permease protein n=1 Tax=Lutibaculum baratangense AMV1 TaxID=631454 RepID=V4R3R9_9HYPH|nr:ABC transporter permease [Lutibaculum baratangense]ESR26597.1 putative deoxyribose-specific ABC transporter, permease protein [Lutibaculum baratangense AMV1]
MWAEAIILTVITAATPLALAALGELVTERSGVLNLGVEGMMAVGAVTAFAVAVTTGSGAAGILAGAMAGAALSLIFAFLTITLATNQVATGLALTLFGLGISGVIGDGFVGISRPPLPQLEIPGLSDLPLVGRILFRQDAMVYLSIALTAGVWWFLSRSRQGLKLRAVGDSHASAHALGLNVMLTRYLAVMFGGACAGLGGAYLSLAYTPMWIDDMTAGRGWIALALVVFATWMPWRLLAGAYLFGAITILQFHAQGAGIGLPSQLMSSLPYLATIVALVLISGRGRLALRHTPLSLGKSFVPER